MKIDSPDDLADGQRASGLLQAIGCGDTGVQLTHQERQLISNFRAMRASAKNYLVDVSAEYKRTLPAEPIRLTVVGGPQ